MAITIVTAGESASFPHGETPAGSGNGLVVIGKDAGLRYGSVERASAAFIALELGTECLASHVGLNVSDSHARTVGFARFRMGKAEPSQLVELVRMPWTELDAVNAARNTFESMGLVVALCEDFPGRIVNRLIRPYLNAVLRRYDERLASADDLDMTLCLGLGYPEGPLAMLDRTGLVEHYDVSEALSRQLGEDFIPARRALVAKARAVKK